MKNYLILLAAILCSCQPQQKESTGSAESYDTIKTGSGLQYYYLKKGTGRQIEDGSYVAAYNKLYLNDVDTVFWSTDNSEDSVFTWVQGKTGLIKGANELYPLLREGDEVIAIMPDSIAYGKEDNNGLPGGSTLIFNPIIIKSVSAPKLSLSDTLFSTYQRAGVDEMMNVYQSIADSEQSEAYHMNIDMMGDLLAEMLETKDYAAVRDVATRFEPMTDNKNALQNFWYFQILAYAQEGDTTSAIALLQTTIEKDPEETYWKEMLKEMQ